jgi:hypothetical protein
MNNLFSLRSPKKTVFTKAYITATTQTIVQDTLTSLFEELNSPNITDTYTIFIDPQKEAFSISLCSQNNHILTLFKINRDLIQSELHKSLIDKNLILAHQLFKLKIFFK